MLTFRNTNIFFVTLLVGVVLAHLTLAISFWIYIAIILSYSLILFYGCYYIGSNFFIKVICAADTAEKVIAISFDDGPHETGTPHILQILKDNDVEAAFFCIGKNIAGKEAVVTQINQQGHIIGNHSYSHHFWFDMFSADKMLADIKQMDAALHPVIGLKPRLFRPPYGVINPSLKKAILKGAYIPVGWSVRSLDTVIKDKAKLLNKLLTRLNPGAVFLFHDTSATTTAVLPAFIKQAKAQGYTIARLDKMLNLQAYA